MRMVAPFFGMSLRSDVGSTHKAHGSEIVNELSQLHCGVMVLAILVLGRIYYFQ
jgi:hypothetical protein